MARVAVRYAKSLIDTAVERKELEAVNSDMLLLQDICKQSDEFVRVLKIPVIKPAMKIGIVNAVVKGKVSETTLQFLALVIEKGRENILPEILAAFESQYNELKGIHKVNLITAIPASEEIQKLMIEKIKKDTRLQNVELVLQVRESLIGGFILEYNNYLVDASVSRELSDIKRQFRENVYVYNIR